MLRAETLGALERFETGEGHGLVCVYNHFFGYWCESWNSEEGSQGHQEGS